jgi:hypothetical protein
MSEIRGTLEQVRRRLNDFVNAAHRRPGEWVVLSNITDDSGNPSESVKDKLVMVLANIQRETAISTFNPNAAIRNDAYGVVAPPLYIDLFVFFYANFIDRAYCEGLTVISRAISFFQQNPWFTRENLPGLDPAIDKLTFELTNLDLVEVNHLLGMFGARYLPSVYYKVRMIPFQGGAMQAEVPAAQGISNPGDVMDPPLRRVEEA